MNGIRNIPNVHEAYNSARKSLVFTSGLLLGWIFLGIEVKQFAFLGIEIGVSSEESLPTVLIIFIFFFALRLVFEYYQIDFERKNKKATKWDFVTTLFIALFSLIIFVFDLNPRVNLSEIILKDWFYAIFIGICYGFFCRIIIGQLTIRVSKDWHRYLFHIFLIGFLFMTFYWEILNGNYLVSISALISITISYILFSKAIVKLSDWLG